MLNITLPERLMFSEVDQLLSSVREQLSSSDGLLVDMKKVEHVNSVLVAFLICVIKNAEQEKVKLVFSGFTEDFYGFLGDSELVDKIRSFCC